MPDKSDLSRATMWYLSHIDHCDSLKLESNAAVAPSGSDCSHPELWKGIHWNWFGTEECRNIYYGRTNVKYSKINMMAIHGKEFTDEFDAEFGIEQDFWDKPKLPVRYRLTQWFWSLASKRTFWYVIGFLDGALLLGVLNHFFNFLR
jgi:hypothetical protein